jgi:PAS domain S-box-containing protein
MGLQTQEILTKTTCVMKDQFDILIIDDTIELSLTLRDILESNGYGTDIAPDRKTAIAACSIREFGLALIDIKLPDANGLELVEELSGILPDMEYIVITGFGTIENAAEAVKNKKIVSFEMKPLDLKRFLLLIQQIRERKLASEALRLSEKRFQIFAESATDAIISIDEEGNIFYLNPEFEKIFGYNIQEMIGKPITILFSTGNIQSPKDAITSIINSAASHEGKRLEIQGYLKNGKLVPLEISLGGFSTKEGKFYTAIVRDITERKEAEINLQRKLLIEKIVSAISTRLVGIADFDQAIYDSLRELRKYTKARNAFILNRNNTEKKTNKTYALNEHGKSSILYKGSDKFQLLTEWFYRELDVKSELIIPRTSEMPDYLGIYKSVLISLGIHSLVIFPIMGKGEVAGILGFDNIENPGLWTREEFNLLITLSNLFSSAFRRRTVEQDLKESEEIHRILLDATKEGIVIIDHHGRITEVSNITLEIFNFTNKEDAIGRRFLQFIPEEFRKNREAYSPVKLKKGFTQNLELALLKNDHTRFIAEVNISFLNMGMDDAKGYLIVIRDITERKSMDNKLIHTERMAGIGVMAAGMAHEINQPLNTISLTMDNLLLSINSGSPDKTYLKSKTVKIFDNITRIRNIIDHVRAFSKEHDDYIQDGFNIHDSIWNAVSLVSEQFKNSGIQLGLSLDETLPGPLGNTYKFEQVIVNLLINAKDAIEEKANILQTPFEGLVEINSALEDSFINVTVKDNGVGIEKRDIDKVMLPFYTTKREGVGTGLGLSISFGIIRDMNGNIEIKSERLVGTQISINIPVNKAGETNKNSIN